MRPYARVLLLAAALAVGQSAPPTAERTLEAALAQLACYDVEDPDDDTGSRSQSVVSSCSCAGEIKFSGHGLSGTIPAALGACARATALDLEGNRLTGTLPPELSALRRR